MKWGGAMVDNVQKTFLMLVSSMMFATMLSGASAGQRDYFKLGAHKGYYRTVHRTHAAVSKQRDQCSVLIEDLRIVPPVIRNIIIDYFDSGKLYHCMSATMPPENFHSEIAMVSAMAAIGKKHVAVGMLDKIIYVWDVESGVMVSQLEGHTNTVFLLVQLPHKRLASGSIDKTVRIWDVSDPLKGVYKHTLTGHKSLISFLTRCGERVVSGSHNGEINIWNATLNGLEQSLKIDNSRYGNICSLASKNDGILMIGTEQSWFIEFDQYFKESLAIKINIGPLQSLTLLDDGTRVFVTKDCVAGMLNNKLTVSKSIERDSALCVVKDQGGDCVWTAWYRSGIRVYDNQGKCFSSYPEYDGVTALVMMPDGMCVMGTHQGDVLFYHCGIDIE